MHAVSTTSASTKVVSASTLAGYRVRSHRNEDLATIEELMVDPESGCIAYAVLCLGGFVGVDDRLYAVPWARFRLNTDDRVLVFDGDGACLDGAPSFQQDDWPDFSDRQWEDEIREYYGARPFLFSQAS